MYLLQGDKILYVEGGGSAQPGFPRAEPLKSVGSSRRVCFVSRSITPSEEEQKLDAPRKNETYTTQGSRHRVHLGLIKMYRSLILPYITKKRGVGRRQEQRPAPYIGVWGE